MPAMPFVEPDHPGSIYPGLTKREHFAAMAMQGILSNPRWEGKDDYLAYQVASSAVRYADALLAELERAK